LAYQRVTLATLRAQLLDRLGSVGTFWSTDELNAGINEAVAIWQLLTGEKVITVTQTVGSTTANLFDVVTNHSNGKVLSIIRITPSESTAVEVPFSWSQSSEQAVVSFSFTLLEEYLGVGGTAQVTWNWGDSTSNTYTVSAVDAGVYTKTHTYPVSDDTYTVTLTIFSDLFQGGDSASMTTNWGLGQTGSSA
jgi:hypothetical protein